MVGWFAKRALEAEGCGVASGPIDGLTDFDLEMTLKGSRDEDKDRHISRNSSSNQAHNIPSNPSEPAD